MVRPWELDVRGGAVEDAKLRDRVVGPAGGEVVAKLGAAAAARSGSKRAAVSPSA